MLAAVCSLKRYFVRPYQLLPTICDTYEFIHIVINSLSIANTYTGLVSHPELDCEMYLLCYH